MQQIDRLCQHMNSPGLPIAFHTITPKQKKNYPILPQITPFSEKIAKLGG
jgi:hypothetical protein